MIFAPDGHHRWTSPMDITDTHYHWTLLQHFNGDTENYSQDILTIWPLCDMIAQNHL